MPFRVGHSDGTLSERPAEFIWLNVRNRATSAHSDAAGVLGHLWVYDDAGHEVFTLRARWRATPTPSQVAPGTITDRLTIGSGLTEQLDAVWKHPDEAIAFGLNTEAITREPQTWQDRRLALPPGHYRLKVKVEGTNGPPAEATFGLVNPGVGSLTVDAAPTAAVQLDDLTEASDVLAKLAADIPTPRDDMDQDVLLFALIGFRARTLYGNFLHATTSPTNLGPVLAIAPLVELAILVKWLALDPDLHRVLWFSESDATELIQIDVITTHLQFRGNTPTPGDPTQLELKEQGREEGRARLAAAGRDYGERLMPTLAQMVEEVEAATPGYKVAMRDAYDLAYRVFNPWQHTEASTFKSTAEVLDAGGWKFDKDHAPFNPEDLKAMAAAMYAFALETVLAGTKTGQPQIVRAVRDFVTVHWVRPDRIAPDD